MEPKAKYFPQTAAALQSLQETAAELKQAAEHSAAQNKNQAENPELSVLRHQIADKAARIDAVIASLGKAVK